MIWLRFIFLVIIVLTVMLSIITTFVLLQITRTQRGLTFSSIKITWNQLVQVLILNLLYVILLILILITSITS